MKPGLAYLTARIAISPTGCWLWTLHVRDDGYAVVSFRDNGRMTADYVHRLAYEAIRGPIAKGAQLDHLCRVRHCLNPAHLEAVTPQENTVRGVGPTAMNAAKTSCKHGHEFTPANTHVRPNGGRTCRECARAKCRRQHARRRIERTAA